MSKQTKTVVAEVEKPVVNEVKGVLDAVDNAKSTAPKGRAISFPKELGKRLLARAGYPEDQMFRLNRMLSDAMKHPDTRAAVSQAKGEVVTVYLSADAVKTEPECWLTGTVLRDGLVRAIEADLEKRGR